MGQPPAAGRNRHPWRALALAAVLVVGSAIVLVRAGGSSHPSIEYRPSIVDLVASIEQAGAAWDVLSPRVGDLMLADSWASPSWVAFSSGGGGAAGEECYPINEGAVAEGGRIVFRSGLSVPIGSWRREPLPSPGVELAGACLDRRGSAVERILGPA
jgi:hypothetical protein